MSFLQNLGSSFNNAYNKAQQPGSQYLNPAQQPSMMAQQPGMGMGQTSVFGTPYTTYKQGILNAIARWNVVDSMSTPEQKNAKIQQALQEVMNTPNLGSFGATQAFSSAASNYANSVSGLYNTARNRMGSNGGKRKQKKTRKARKARKMRGG